ncbi:unnamed protein product, partial [marine sediment metagenome]
MMETSRAYPVSLSIDYPDRKLDKLSSFFRVFAAIPILIILSLVIGATYEWGGGGGWSYYYAAAGIVVIP